MDTYTTSKSDCYCSKVLEVIIFLAMADAFLSYAREDQTVARRLHEALVAAGLDIWIDEHGLTPGKKWKPTISRAIRESTFFLALMSSRSLSKRGFVQKELRLAFEVMDELPPEQVFFIPLRIDLCEPTEERIREVQWLDLFPSWDLAIRKLISVIRPLSEKPERRVDSDGHDSCPVCGRLILNSDDRCPSCGSDVGVPNVRHALAERDALHHRYEAAVEQAARSGCLDLVRELEERAKTSEAVITMGPAALFSLLGDNNQVYWGYRSGLGSEQTQLEKIQLWIEGVLFGSYSTRIRYANLSTCERGLRRYGPIDVVLKDVSVASRATVLQENSYEFVRKHLLADKLPQGYVAVWSDRQKLAVAKLGPLLCRDGAPKRKEWLLREGANRDDFMEVHIYGGLDAYAIRSIVSAKEIRKTTDKAIMTAIEHLAAKRNIEFK